MRVPVAALQVGMFVSEPDCGWRNTSFPIEGLLLQDRSEIEQLARFTDQVTIDPGRSAPEALADLRCTAPHGLETEEAAVAATIAERIDAEPDGRFRQYASRQLLDGLAGSRLGLSERLKMWWRTQRAAFGRRIGAPVSRPMPRAVRPSYIPGEFALVVYRDPEPTPMALPQAKAACQRIEQEMRHIVRSVGETGAPDSEAVRVAADTLVDNMMARPATMLWVAKLRANSDERYQKAVRVAVHLTAFGRKIGFQKEQLDDLASIGLLMDIGKIGIPAEVLDKKEPLDESEADMLRHHVERAVDMLGRCEDIPPVVIRAIAEHHERVDGTGYPRGLSGSDLSIYGKMAAIADAYVAMTNPRSYALQYTSYDAIRELFNDADSGLYGPLVEQFVQAIGIFPVGSMIELSTGEVAIVVQHNETRRLEPRILVLTDADQQMLDEPREVDMLQLNQRAEQAVHIRRGLVEGSYGIDFRNYYLATRRAGR